MGDRSRRLTPQEKKRLAYERDHYVEAEYQPAFRKGWPRKKANASRRFRRRGERLVEAVGLGPAGEVMEAGEDAAVTSEHVRDSLSKRRLYKWGVFSLRERVERKLAGRVERVGINAFFRYEYDPAEHREAFAAFLASLVAGHGEGSRALAERFRRELDPPPSDGSLMIRSHRPRQWLQAFFRDEPAWEGRLRAWMDEVLGDEEARP